MFGGKLREYSLKTHKTGHMNGLATFPWNVSVTLAWGIERQMQECVIVFLYCTQIMACHVKAWGRRPNKHYIKTEGRNTNKRARSTSNKYTRAQWLTHGTRLINHLRNPQGHESPKHTAQVLASTNGHCNINRQHYGEQRAHIKNTNQWK
jgi:hypothetical protein